MQDKIFLEEQNKQFEFDDKVASVFDDMLIRSIPFYNIALDLSIDFILKHIQEIQTPVIYDLGSSTGNFLINLAQKIKGSALLFGIDNSQAMINRSIQKSLAYNLSINFENTDILDYSFNAADVVVSHYTIQFIRPLQREKLIKKIFDSLKPNGIFIMSEKMTSFDKQLDKQMIERYYQFKQEQGYSKNEITGKREALENVLIPYSLDENIQMLKNAGFKINEVLFKWVNFGTIIAKKIL